MVIIDNLYKWSRIPLKNYVVYYIGLTEELDPIVHYIDNTGEGLIRDELDKLLSKCMVAGSIIMESDKHIIAIVDHFRCYPIYYTHLECFIISNSARKLCNLMGDKKRIKWNRDSLKEVEMSGYVTGSDTLIHGLKQFQSGECLVVNKKSNSIDIRRYYRYTPKPICSKSDDEWIKELDVIMNRVTKRMIDRANNGPIRIALSAGLDSRILICKLHEFEYKNLESFSYGPKGSWEAKGAKRVAKRLSIPWKLITLSRKEAHNIFWGSERKKYFNFLDGLSSLSFSQEFFAFSKIKSNQLIPDDSIIINGQSGDFISGGHVPESLLMKGANIETLLNLIIKKHYSLQKDLLTEERLDFIKEKILGLMGISDINNELTSEDLITLYEQGECEERQVKWVINCQRAQDFFGYDWQMPLWDIELAKFYSKVPIHLKINQNLYKLWLKKWNYKGLFVDFKPTVWKWPGYSIIIVFMAKPIGFFFGGKVKKSWYELFHYWGHDRDYYAPYSYYYYFKVRKAIRNYVPLNIKTWIKENKNLLKP